MPCPFTGPKMFCAGPNVLCQTKNLFTYCGSRRGRTAAAAGPPCGVSAAFRARERAVVVAQVDALVDGAEGSPSQPAQGKVPSYLAAGRIAHQERPKGATRLRERGAEVRDVVGPRQLPGRPGGGGVRFRLLRPRSLGARRRRLRPLRHIACRVTPPGHDGAVRSAGDSVGIGRDARLRHGGYHRTLSRGWQKLK